MIWKIKIIVSAITFIGLAGLLGYGYIKITSLESDLKVAQGQLNEAHNANIVWQETWNQSQEDREKERMEAKRIRQEFTNIQKEFNRLRIKQERHNYEKIMEKKPGALYRVLIRSTNRMFRADEADSQAYYNSETEAGAPTP